MLLQSLITASEVWVVAEALNVAAQGSGNVFTGHLEPSIWSVARSVNLCQGKLRLVIASGCGSLLCRLPLLPTPQSTSSSSPRPITAMSIAAFPEIVLLWCAKSTSFSIFQHMLESALSFSLSVHLYTSMDMWGGRKYDSPLKHAQMCLFWALSELVYFPDQQQGLQGPFNLSRWGGKG